MAVCRLMSNLKKLGERVWNGFLFLMTGPNGGLLWSPLWIIGFYRTRRIYWLYSMKIV